MTAVLEVDAVVKRFSLGSSVARAFGRTSRELVAVDDVSFTVGEGETLGIVGESGSGKSVTAEMIMRLQAPTEGRITYGGADIHQLSGDDLRAYRRAVQIVFQNPYDALNPTKRIWRSVAEPLAIHKVCPPEEHRERVTRVLAEVGLAPAESYLDRYPHELSGGEVQRVAIGRALVLDPELIVADEPTSMLDVSVRAGVLNLLRDLRQRRGLSMVFISHDFSTIRYVCDRTAVMQAGEIVEIGPTREVIDNRRHPYSKALIAALPIPGDGLQRKRVILSGRRHDPTSDWPGCRYAGRCPLAEEQCQTTRPRLVEVSSGHSVACHVVAASAGSKDQEVHRPPPHQSVPEAEGVQ
ncbi:MAG TPA: ABC transporter ATP-binding protein [Solirubrobacteraceae bacterium]|nr:ABC transporter ATP-binding protein [Solirubrobacteraceae bacterium]